MHKEVGNWIGSNALFGAALYIERRFSLIETATRSMPTARWIEQLEAVAVPCGHINDLQQAIADPQVQACGVEIRIADEQGNETRVAGNCLRLSASPVSYRLACTPSSLEQCRHHARSRGCSA